MMNGGCCVIYSIVQYFKQATIQHKVIFKYEGNVGCLAPSLTQ
jgi:hypothetical protein